MSLTLSPNMSLPVPTVGDEAGPDYAIDVNNCLSIIDQHNHTAGSGVPITPSAMNINADLTMIGNSLTNVKSVQLTPQVSLATALSLYVASGGETPSINDLWYNDGNGTTIQLTKSGLVNATLASLAGQSYSAGTFYWKQGLGSTVPANFDIGNIVLRPNIAATTYSTTIQTNASLVTSYTLTLPNNPSGLASNSFLTMDASGNITAGPTVNAGLTTANLSPTAGILGSQIAANTITENNLAFAGGFTPTGAIIAYGGVSAPSGYLLCDGSSYLRATYPALFTAISTAYGTADGTHFNVPDLRGQFLRGVSGASSNDPGKASRTAMATGGNTGNNVGSIQTQATAKNGLVLSDPGHTHGISAADGSNPDTTNIVAAPVQATTTISTNSASSGVSLSAGDAETRPINAYVNFIIKT